MARAYERAIQPKENPEQIIFEFESLPEAQPLFVGAKSSPEVYVPTETLCHESSEEKNVDSNTE